MNATASTALSVVFAELPGSGGLKIGHAELNMPASLNALTTDMVELLLQHLQQWQQDPAISCVLISGSGERAFCAGGDVQALRNSAIENPGGPCTAAETFFAREYRLDYSIHTYKKPVVVWGDGIVMGGGLGILAAASHRVVTEISRFAMPEVTIGLYPDVGGSYFLNQMPGCCGRFLALTGASFNATDAVYVGIADFFIRRDQYAHLLTELQRATPVKHAEMTALLEELASPYAATMPVGNVESHRGVIDTLCAENDIHRVVGNFANLATDDAWLVKAKNGIAHGSPLSILLIDVQLARSVGAPLAKVFRQELVLSTNIVRYPEFAEGVRALLVDKDRQPKWQYANIASVPAGLVEDFFKPPWQQHPLADL